MSIVLSSIILAFLLLGGGFAYLYHNFYVVRVSGTSMLPTYKDRDILLARKRGLEHPRALVPGRPILLVSPSGEVVIKRLVSAHTAASVHPEWDSGLAYWVEGDNPGQSYDSRHYGYVHESAILGYFPKRDKRTIQQEQENET